ncbi:MAG: alpha-hydroxy-acid oxidizing protein, partial [Candidatus Hodarchaeales archaeon]
MGDAGFGKYRFNHNALPEIDFEKIDTSTKILGKKVDYPFFISCMSGGINKGLSFNNTLAKAAQKYGIAMGVGSQRIAIEYPVYEKQFQVRKYAPDIPLIANIGLVQLNYGYGLKEFQKCIDMIDADALAVHINPIQEVVQPEGDRNFEKLLPKLEKLVKKLTVPIIVKEVGFGLSESVAVRLNKIGIAI